MCRPTELVSFRKDYDFLLFILTFMFSSFLYSPGVSLSLESLFKEVYGLICLWHLLETFRPQEGDSFPGWRTPTLVDTRLSPGYLIKDFVDLGWNPVILKIHNNELILEQTILDTLYWHPWFLKNKEMKFF